jgi:hypothetical protein
MRHSVDLRLSTCDLRLQRAGGRDRTRTTLSRHKILSLLSHEKRPYIHWSKSLLAHNSEAIGP